MGGGVQPGYWNGYLTGLMRAFFRQRGRERPPGLGFVGCHQGRGHGCGISRRLPQARRLSQSARRRAGQPGFPRARGTGCHQSVRDDQRLAVCFMLSVYVQPDERRHGGIMNVPERPDGGFDDLPRTRIVGLGASAGGLEPLEQFLANTPPDSGLAYVVVQHLDPTHKAMLVELLQRATTMPVREAGESMRVERDSVYVIPPNNDLSVRHGLLHLTKPMQPRGMRLPIDTLFCSLAREQGDQAIGVVLSGMGVGRDGGLAGDQDPGRRDAGAATGVGPVRFHAEVRHRRRFGGHRRDPSRTAAAHRARDSAQQRELSRRDSRWRSQRRAGARRNPRHAARTQQARSLAVQDQHAEAQGRASHGRARPRLDGRVSAVPA